MGDQVVGKVDATSLSSGPEVPDPPEDGGGGTHEEKSESPNGVNAGHNGNGEDGNMEVAKEGGNECSQEGRDDNGLDHGSDKSAACHSSEAEGSARRDANKVAPFEQRSEDGPPPPCCKNVGVSGPSSEIDLHSNTSVPKTNEIDERPCLWEAKRDGEWFKAIEARDCLSLMNILKAQKDNAARLSLCFETGEQGRMALHVASMQGCFRLAKQAIDLVMKKHPCPEDRSKGYVISRKHFSGSYIPCSLSQVAGEYIDAEDGRSGLTAFDMANDIIGNTSISQYILYVMMPPTLKKEYPGMYEAYEGTEWHYALAGGNCEMLKELLNWNSRYVLETCDGLSVLDVGILQDDKVLVEQVTGLFGGPTNPKISWHEESYFPSELCWKQIAVKYKYDIDLRITRYPWTKSKMELVSSVYSALELAEKNGSTEEIKRLLRNVEQHCQEGPPPILRSGVPNDVILGPADSYFSDELELVMSRWWRPLEWDDEFLADVDYNFEDRESLRFSILRFHYAFKHPAHRFVNELLYLVIHSDICSGIIRVCDGRGRTPFHVMVDYYNPSDFSFDALHSFTRSISYDFFIYGGDSRGRSPMLRAITKQFLENEKMTSRDLVRFCESYEYEKTRYRALTPQHGSNISGNRKWKYGTSYAEIPPIHLLFITAFFMEDVDILRFILNHQQQNAKKPNFEAFLGGSHVRSFDGDGRGETVEVRSFLIAAASGNQTLLRECLKSKCDCMVEDEQGRTALHYAVDANMFKFLAPPTSFYCSIEYPSKVKEQWLEKRKTAGLVLSNGNSNGGQDSNQNLQSNASVGRRACILMLLQAGVDLSQADKKGDIPDPGNSSDASFQSWWYDTLVKDAEDKKNSFNQAGNALSVVGTLVAATSYIGPLQPPLSYHDGYVDTTKSLVKVFMWTNTLAFYLAVASVMFAVVPSLPMPQEGVLDELRRARHTVSSSLFLLLASIGCILASFAAATAVVVNHDDYYGARDLLLSPSVIGWFFCAIAMLSFFIRVMRLVFYRNSAIRQIYQFSFSALVKKWGRAVYEAVFEAFTGMLGYMGDMYRRFF
ncbi:hypothetical protein KC19_9G168100 [Ceratodon purpureus]|uniref:PGG domain-containing protein n=1 Tax=Ceratodon purpureus TaxID=3225 RepID=A0A8T0GWF4_CERPU|nr:hypothetical protein KC19_9G168100 [Ceratodon purpureus]KAG0562735.1 hypothetical protein KC19_9G168100 [Ceratodon purpureus]KAG0562736.1 hypothetical protein KC19_9G168100 [Ceratodon purpureus]KAG0562737.1 hypothetical protein KC19_9G168100 [Ceratodon purpureus]KAG0562738.1 hypothetical protein KC19_9G168100 [Ceratodon purpureus]